MEHREGSDAVSANRFGGEIRVAARLGAEHLLLEVSDDGARIHRSTLVNLAWTREVGAWFGGKLLVRLRDAKGTELQVARERVAELKKKLGI